MRFSQLLVLAFAAAASAAPTWTKFKFFTDQSCQRYDGTYVNVTAAQLEEITVDNWDEALTEDSSLSTSSDGPEDKIKCPPNSDHTFKWVGIPQWQEGNKWGPDAGGAIAVVYYEETDTYHFCHSLAAAQQSHGYAGFCE